MTVYVDELRTPPVNAPATFRRAGFFCHMMADTDEELEAMATRIGLRKGWRHEDHYDLTWMRRIRAVRCGAVEVTARELVKIRKRGV